MNAPRIDISITSDLWVHLHVGSGVPIRDEFGDVRDIAWALKGWLERNARSIDEIARIVPQSSRDHSPPSPGSVPSGAIMRVLWQNASGDLILVVEREGQRTLVTELRGDSYEVS